MLLRVEESSRQYYVVYLTGRRKLFTSLAARKEAILCDLRIIFQFTLREEKRCLLIRNRFYGIASHRETPFGTRAEFCGKYVQYYRHNSSGLVLDTRMLNKKISTLWKIKLAEIRLHSNKLAKRLAFGIFLKAYYVYFSGKFWNRIRKINKITYIDSDLN